jgi:hypothetical protein
MTCERSVDLIIDALMDSLDDEEKERLEAHLRSCPSCAAEARALRWTWDGLGRLEAPAATAPGAPGRGPLAASGPRTSSIWFRAAAAIALLLVGGAGGFWVRGSPESDGPPVQSAFLFLVRGDEPDATVPEETLIREYGAWATELAGEGRLLGGEKLTDGSGRWVSITGDETRTRSDVSGFFVVAAADYAEAVEIAGASPHVRYGGTFEIRQIDHVN